MTRRRPSAHIRTIGVGKKRRFRKRVLINPHIRKRAIRKQLMLTRSSNKLTPAARVKRKMEYKILIKKAQELRKREPAKRKIQFLVDPKKLDQRLPKDAIPSIDSPNFVSVDDAEMWMKDTDYILAINYKGVRRAYPIKIMAWHEIINDRIAGDPILITYCPLCSSQEGFIRKLDGKEVEFGTSGALYKNNLVMYDRKTNSLWSQLGGISISGDQTGTKLKKVPLKIAKWGDWKTGGGRVLSLDTGFKRDYLNDPYESKFKERLKGRERFLKHFKERGL